MIAPSLKKIITGILITISFTGLYAKGNLGAGRGHSGILHDGKLYTWGQNTHGQLGHGGQVSLDTPTLLSIGEDWKSISFGALHCVGLTESGKVYVWGANHFGQLGLGDTESRATPTEKVFAKTVKAVSAGTYTTFILCTDGSVYAAGRNNKGQLALGTSSPFENSFQTSLISDVNKLAAGADHTLFIKYNRSLWGVGGFSFGKLDSSSHSGMASTPIQIGSDTDWADIAVGLFHNLALKTNDDLLAWGKNNNKQVDSSAQDKGTPQLVANNTSSFSAGAGSTLLIKDDGSIYGLGDNRSGQLANSEKSARNNISQISSDLDWRDVISGPYHTLARKSNSNVYAWGNNRGNQVNGMMKKSIVSPTLVFSAPLTSKIDPVDGLTLGMNLTLTTNDTVNPTANPLTYTWELLSSPVGSSTSLTGPLTSTAVINLDAYGEYTIKLTVNDGVNTDEGITTITLLTSSSEWGGMVWGADSWASIPLD